MLDFLQSLEAADGCRSSRRIRVERVCESMILDSLGLRVLEGLPFFMALVIPQVRIRFQLAPGTSAGLGIDAVPFEILSGGVSVFAGNTDPNGEVSVALPLVQAGNCAIRIFGAEFPITLLPAWDAVTTRTGRQQRFDHLGYVRGYQLSTTIDPPADGTLTERFHHSINDFQWDEDIAVDGDAGPVTQGRLTTAAGL